MKRRRRFRSEHQRRAKAERRRRLDELHGPAVETHDTDATNTVQAVHWDGDGYHILNIHKM